MDNNTDDITAVIQTIEDQEGWGIFPIKLKLPGDTEVIITVRRNATVSDINRRLDEAFGFRMYQLSVIVDGEILPAPPHQTLGHLGDNGAEFVVNVVEEIWDDGLEIK